MVLAVFLLWQDCERQFSSGPLELKAVLETYYGIRSFVVYIPERDASLSLHRELDQILKTAGVGISLLLYYAGSFAPGVGLTTASLASQTAIPWESLRDLLKSSKSILLLLQLENGVGRSESRLLHYLQGSHDELPAEGMEVLFDREGEMTGRIIEVLRSVRGLESLTTLSLRAALNHGHHTANWLGHRCFSGRDGAPHIEFQRLATAISDTSADGISIKVNGGQRIDTGPSPSKQYPMLLLANDRMDVENIVRRLNNDPMFLRRLQNQEGRYRQVVVLPMTWEDTDGFDPREELRPLRKVLRDEFHFSVSPTYQIPKKETAQDELRAQIVRVLEGMDGRDLIILIYNGHGVNSSGEHSGARRSIWSPGGDSSVSVCWSEIQPLLNSSPCDVAQIIDCCYAAQAVKRSTSNHLRDILDRAYAVTETTGDHDSTPAGRNEVLCACDRQNEANAGNISYTNLLSEVLNRLVKGRPNAGFTLEEVHNQVDTMCSILDDNPDLHHLMVPTPYRKNLVPGNSSIVLRPLGVNTGRTAWSRQIFAQAFLSDDADVDNVEFSGFRFFTKEQLLQQLGEGES